MKNFTLLLTSLMGLMGEGSYLLANNSIKNSCHVISNQNYSSGESNILTTTSQNNQHTIVVPLTVVIHAELAVDGTIKRIDDKKIEIINIDGSSLKDTIIPSIPGYATKDGIYLVWQGAKNIATGFSQFTLGVLIVTGNSIKTGIIEGVKLSLEVMDEIQGWLEQGATVYIKPYIDSGNSKPSNTVRTGARK